ncbi:MAG: hypothetical protein WC548_04600 [Candidatus Pacearchaeota archaeon]
MRCSVCRKSGDEVELFKGISEDGVVMICEFCAEREGMPIIKKPTMKQLEDADKRYSVRERMERMSGRREITDISPDQSIVQRNLSKLRMPEKRQSNEEVVYDYNWVIKIERRRRKMTTSQLAHGVGVSADVINQIEQGKLPKNFKEIFLKIESFLGVKLLKNHEPLVAIKTKEDEYKILQEVGQKIGIKVAEKKFEDENEPLKKIEEPEKLGVSNEKKEKLNRLSKGELDFSRRTDLTNVTLNDLVDMKRAREKREERIRKESRADVVGDDINISDEDLDFNLDEV